MQSLLSASENSGRFSMQSTPAPAPQETESPQLSAEPVEEDVWNVWPYCWAIAGWEVAGAQAGQLQEKFFRWKLQRLNRREQKQFRRRLWQRREREQSREECELTLI